MEDASLVDYLRPLRRSWPLIAAMALVSVAVALVISVAQDKTYASKATLLVQDPSQALAVAGTSVRPANSAVQQAEQSAQTFLTTAVLRKVREGQGSAPSVDQLRDDVSVTPDTTTNLITLEAHSSSASAAAALANRVAGLGAEQQNRKVRSRYARAAEVLNRRLRALPASGASSRALATGYQEQISRLETLSSVATPVEIAQHARTPHSSISPKPLRNALVALVLGLFLGAILAYLREGFDRTIRGPRDLYRPGSPLVVGQLSELALGHASLGDEAGEPMPAADAEAFRVLRANLETLDPERPPGVILVTSPTAQEGKTSVAGALAESLSAVKGRVLLLECDLRRPDLASRLGIAARPGLANYLSGNTRLEDVTKVPRRLEEPSSNGGTGAWNLSVIPAGNLPPNPAEMLASNAPAELLGDLASAYDTIVIDTCPLLPVADTLGLLPYVDVTLLCVRVRRTTLQQVASALAALQRHGDSAVGIVVTGLSKQDRDYYPADAFGGDTATASATVAGDEARRQAEPVSPPGSGSASGG